MAMTKPKLTKALKDLGVEADPKATNKDLEKQLKAEQKKKDKADKDAEAVADKGGEGEKGDGNGEGEGADDEGDGEESGEGAGDGAEGEADDKDGEGEGEGDDDDRLKPAGEEAPVPTSKKKIKDGDDYLQQYQYKKQTKFGSKDTNPAPGSDAAKTKAFLLNQERVTVFIPREKDESVDIPQSVNLNGYRLDLPKQEYLTLPEEILNIVMEALDQSQAAILRGQISGNKEKESALRK